MSLIPRAAWLLLLVTSSCAGPDSAIPALDGALVADVVYPRPGTPVPGNDSIALWGTLGTGRANLKVNGARVTVERNGTFAAFLPVPSGRAPSLRLVARRGGDSLVRTVPLRREPLSESSGGEEPGRGAPEGNVRAWSRWVTIRRLPSDTADSATQWRPIFSRWRPGGEVAIPLPQGLRLQADARTARSIRLRLAPDERVWIPMEDADTTARPRAEVLRAGPPVIRFDSTEFRLSIALPERLPTTVELSGDRLLWTVYGATWGARPPARDGDGTLVRRIVPRDSAAGRLVVDLGLVALPLGWRTEWRAGALHLRVRHPLPPSGSLRALVVTLDPGHPPDGTTGPSGLMEDSVTLAVAHAAAVMLRARGATVHLTRTDRTPLSLEARAVAADRSDTHLFISLHLNAPGPGRPPVAVFGTQTYWMNPNGRVLARFLLTDVARAMGHPAIGMYDGEFAVLRPAWAAAVLVEGSGIVVPEREVFLRTTAGVEAYAQGVVSAIERWRASPVARALSGRPVR